MLHKRFTVLKTWDEPESEFDLLERVDWLSYIPEPGDLVWMNPDAPHDRNYRVVEVQRYTSVNVEIGSEPLSVDVAFVHPVGQAVPPRTDYDFAEAMQIVMQDGEFLRIDFSGGDDLAPVIGERLIVAPDPFTVDWVDVDLGDGKATPIGRSSQPLKLTDYYAERFDTLLSSSSKPYQALYIVWFQQQITAQVPAASAVA